jgi:hypothetical protein
MAHTGSDATDQVRTTELIGALCLATDLGMGFRSVRPADDTDRDAPR